VSVEETDLLSRSLPATLSPCLTAHSPPLTTCHPECRRPDNSGYLPFDFQADADKEFDLFFKGETPTAAGRGSSG
jgi:hypothetical protein